MRAALHGQERNQLSETDRQLPGLDLWSRRSAAGSFPGTLCVENNLRLTFSHPSRLQHSSYDPHISEAGCRVLEAGWVY